MKPIFLILIVILYLAGNYHVFHKIWHAMPANTVGRILLITFSIVVVFSFFVFYIFGESLPIALSSVLYQIGTSWFFIFIYALLITLFVDLIRATRLVPPRYDESIH